METRGSKAPEVGKVSNAETEGSTAIPTTTPVINSNELERDEVTGSSVT